jgi:iron complex transport system substrate-binding protein
MLRRRGIMGGKAGGRSAVPALAASLVAALVPFLAATASAGPPQRIVSLNLCSDQILLDLVPRERIAALSFLAADPAMSADVERTKGIPTVRGAAEEVLALKPDLVLAGLYSTPATQSLLRRLGMPVVGVPLASSFDEIRDTVRLMARVTGEIERGEAMVRDFDRRIANARSAPSSLVGEGSPHAAPPREKASVKEEGVTTALAYQVNSLTSGPGSLIDEMLTAAGLRNLAGDRVLGPGGRLPLETLLVTPPDLLVFANAPDDFRTVLGDNLRHPALAEVLRERRTVHLPMPLWLCGTPHVAEAVEILAAARRSPAPVARPVHDPDRLGALAADGPAIALGYGKPPGGEPGSTRSLLVEEGRGEEDSRIDGSGDGAEKRPP